jgi:hypothetical protein
VNTSPTRNHLKPSGQPLQLRDFGARESNNRATLQNIYQELEGKSIAKEMS